MKRALGVLQRGGRLNRSRAALFSSFKSVQQVVVFKGAEKRLLNSLFNIHTQVPLSETLLCC